MKMIFKDDKMIIFLKKIILDYEKMEEQLKEIFMKINNQYEIELSGYYNIDVYMDRFYGSILEIENIDAEYSQFFSQIDMKINIIKNSDFLYKIDYNMLDSNILKSSFCYQNGEYIYLKLKNEINDYVLAKLLEISEIIYGSEARNIIKYGKKVKL